MPLTPNPQYIGVRKFESTDTNHADVLNAVAQECLNQAAWIKQQIDAVKASQDVLEAAIASLSGYTALKTQAVNLLAAIETEKTQNTTSDTLAGTIESGVTTENTNADVELARIAGLQSAIAGIQIGTNYQAYNANLQAIASAARVNDTYLYSNASAVINWSNPSTLGSGTIIRDCVLKAIISSGGTAPTLTTGAWTDAPLAQIYNNATDKIAYNATSKQITLQSGEYMLDGLFIARSPLTQMQVLNTTDGDTYYGTTGKGTTDANIVTTNEPLAVYSHLLYTFKVTGQRVLTPRYYVSSPGSVLTNSMGIRTPWYMLRISHFAY